MTNPNNWAWGSIRSRGMQLQAAKASHPVIGVMGVAPPDPTKAWLWTLEGSGGFRTVQAFSASGVQVVAPNNIANSTNTVLVARDNPDVVAVCSGSMQNPTYVAWTRDRGLTWRTATIAGHPLMGNTAVGDQQNGFCIAPDGSAFFTLTYGTVLASTGTCADGGARIDKVNLVTGVVTQGFIGANNPQIYFVNLNGSGYPGQCYDRIAHDGTNLVLIRGVAVDTRDPVLVPYCANNPTGIYLFDPVTGAVNQHNGAPASLNSASEGPIGVVTPRVGAGGHVVLAAASNGWPAGTPACNVVGQPNLVSPTIQTVQCWHACADPTGKCAVGYQYTAAGAKRMARTVNGGVSWQEIDYGAGNGVMHTFTWPFDSQYFVTWANFAHDGFAIGDLVKHRWTDGVPVGPALFNHAVSTQTSFCDTSDGSAQAPL